MMKWYFTSKAEVDLSDIFSYSVQKWGLAQALKYDNEIENAIIEIAKNPKSDQQEYAAPIGYCKKMINKHFIIYKITNHSLTIIRILHQSRDIPPHL